RPGGTGDEQVAAAIDAAAEQAVETGHGGAERRLVARHRLLLDGAQARKHHEPARGDAHVVEAVDGRDPAVLRDAQAPALRAVLFHPPVQLHDAVREAAYRQRVPG